jgi:hypothetical protein
MGVPDSDVGYTSALTGRGDHEVHKGHVVALEKNKIKFKNFKKYLGHYLLIFRRRCTNNNWYIACVLRQLAATKVGSSQQT